MSRRLFLGSFTREKDLVQAIAALRQQGLTILDVYTPYAIHGLDEVLGWKPSRLSRACLVCGLAGTMLALWFQHWALAIDWPVNVGGRPFNSWPAYIPVAFETMVLFAGLGVVLAFFLAARLFPGKKEILPLPGITTDRFVVVLEETDAAFDPEQMEQLFRDHHAVQVEEREEGLPAPKSGRRAWWRWNWALAGIFLATMVLHWTLDFDPTLPNREFLPDMAHAVPYRTYSPNPNFGNGKTIQAPEPGTIARGFLPLHFQPTPQDAARAGVELHNPFSKEDKKTLERGAILYSRYCQICHGTSGNGDGPVAQRTLVPGLPALGRSLLSETAMSMKEGQMFHVVTYGQGIMAPYAGQLSREERWQVILHVVHTLQKRDSQKKK